MRYPFLLLSFLTASLGWTDSTLPQHNLYPVKNYEHLIGMSGFSEDALKKHFTLYQGYVKNTNLIMTLLKEMSEEGKQGTPAWNELQRRLGWEWDGMRLHELYFENLGGDGKFDADSTLYTALINQYGNYENWERNFKAVGGLRGIGWVVLYQDQHSHRLINCWIDEHPNGHLAGANPLLIMDLWEHAYMWDYGLDRGAYIEAFLKNVDWEIAQERFFEQTYSQ